MDNPKFCKDCKYYVDNNESVKIAMAYAMYIEPRSWCKNPKNIKFDLVDGQELIIEDIRKLRSDNEKYGKSAAWFEPKDIEQVKPD